MSKIILGAVSRPLREPIFKKFFGQILSSQSEGNRCREYHAPERDAEADGNDVAGDAELFKGHGDSDQLNAPAGRSRDSSRWRQPGIYCRNEHCLRDEIGQEKAGDQNQHRYQQMWNVGEKGMREVLDGLEVQGAE